MKTTIFCHAVQCNLLYTDQQFGQTYCLHPQEDLYEIDDNCVTSHKCKISDNLNLILVINTLQGIKGISKTWRFS
jgi:hypothetical protein